MIRKFIILLFAVFAFVGSNAAQESEPRLVFAPAFTISAEDEAAGIDGTIKVAADISATGDVLRASVYVGPAWPCDGNLDERVRRVIRDAENAVLKFKFKPAVKDGKSVESRAGLSLTVGKASRSKLEKAESEDSNAPKEPKQINGGVLNGRAISLMKPFYPPEARAARASGPVSVQILVSEAGKVVTAQVINGSPFFHAVARDAACSSRFAPTRLAGKPVKISGLITYNFVP